MKTVTPGAVSKANVSDIGGGRLAESLSGRAEECILRVRRGSTWWEGSNREGITSTAAGPPTRAFRTASITKTFTAAVVLLLAEEGALNLDDVIPASNNAELATSFLSFSVK